MGIFSSIFGKKAKVQEQIPESDSKAAKNEALNTMELARNFLKNFNVKGLEELASELFIKGEYEVGCRLISDFLSVHPNTQTLGGSFANGFDDKNKFLPKHIMNSTFLTSSMNLTSEINNKIRGIIASHFLLGIQGFASKGIASKILDILPNFDCPPIKDYFDKGEPGRWSHLDYEDLDERVQLFYHMIWQEAFSTFDFMKHTTDAVKDKREGLYIYGGDKKCDVCNGQATFFEWKVLDKVPKLPLYPGCVCWYSSLNLNP